MSCVTPPGMATRARSASEADLACVRRNVSWIVIASPSYPIHLAADLCPPIPGRERGLPHERDEPRVSLQWEAVHRRLRAPRDAVHRASVHAGLDEPPLLGGPVQEHLPTQARERGHDA